MLAGAQDPTLSIYFNYCGKAEQATYVLHLLQVQKEGEYSLSER